MGTQEAWETVRCFGCLFLGHVAFFFAVAWMPSIAVKGDSSPGFAMKIELRRKATNLEVGNRASALVLQMERIARDVFGDGQW